jgi:aquaporin Z
MNRELAAEFIGTYALVSAVCGAALFSAPSAGLIAVAFAVGLSVLAMAFAVGPISGGHFNPAVTCGMLAAGRIDMGKAIPYIVIQVIGGAAAAFTFWLVLKGAPAGKWNSFTDASNLYGGPNHFSLGAVFLTEVVITALFLIVITCVTTANCPAGFAPIAVLGRADHRRRHRRADRQDAVWREPVASLRHCEERSDEAIQADNERLDCFASLAMTFT